MLKLVVLSAAFWCASDLDSLSREFEAGKIEVNRQRREDRGRAIRESVVPVLNRIGALKSREAAAFLGKVLLEDMPDLAEAAARPLARTGQPEAVDILLTAVDRRPAAIKVAALAALRDSKTVLSAQQTSRVGAHVLGNAPLDVRRAAVGLLGAQDALAAARILVQALGARTVEEELAASVETALAASTNREVLDYLFREALGGAVKAPQQLVTLLRVAELKKAKEAAPAAEKLLGHAAPEVASAAMATLTSLGFEVSREQVFGLLRKWRTNISPAVSLLVAMAESGSAGAAAVLVDVSREFPGPIGVAALGLLGRTKNDAALGRIIEALGDREQDMKAAAMRAVQQFRDKRIIGPLIDFMGREDGRLKGEAFKFLVRVTGQNMGLEVADWRKWWDYAQERFTFEPEKEGARTHVRVRDVGYYGIEIFSNRICFIIDCSSSMLAEAEDPKTKKRSSRIDLAKRELVETLGKLKPGAMINIISFHAGFTPMARQLTPIAGAGRRKAITHVQNLRTGTGTNIYDTLSEALKDPNVDTIFLLSDGMPTRGRYTDPETILREIRTQNLVRNVTINAIAIGIELDFMRKLAEENGGTYVFVRD